MIIAALPGIPFLRPLARGLELFGVVLPERVEDKLGTDSLHYSIRDSDDADREWNDVLEGLEARLACESPKRTLLGLPHAAVIRGLLRQINAQCGPAYRHFRMMQTLRPRRFRYALAAPRVVRDAFRASGVMVDEGVSVRLWWLARLVLLAHGFFALCRNLAAAFGDGLAARSDAGPNSVIWMGLTAAELRSDAGELNALDFVRERRLALFARGDRLVIAAPWLRSSEPHPDVRAVLAPDPVRESARGRLSLRAAALLIVDAVRAAVRILRDFAPEDGAGLILAGEYARLHRMKRWLDTARPRAVVITNSAYMSQPLWFAWCPSFGCETVMLFYSTNGIHLHMQGEPDPIIGDPAYRLIDCTRFEVWTDGQKRWLTGLGVEADRVHVAGIIVWSRYGGLQHRPAPLPGSSAPVRIGLFDVIPLSRSFWIPRGVGEHYYNVQRMMQVVEDVVELAARLPCPATVRLKSKRARQPNHDAAYWDFVERLVAEGMLEALPRTGNPIDAVTDCDLVISVPFSSPSVIAASVGIPTCFYDPASLLRLPEITVSPEIPLVSGREALRDWLTTSVAWRREGYVVAEDAESRSVPN